MTAERTTGGLLVFSGVAMIIGMGLHPSTPDAVTLANSVHGVMIGVLLLSAWGVIQYLKPRGLGSPLISAGLVAYAAWIVTQMIAGTINGFAVTAMAASTTIETGRDVFGFAWHLNQGLVKVGFFAAGAALALWAIQLLREDSVGSKFVAVTGLIAGALPSLLMLVGALQMNVYGAFIAYGLHALWLACVGITMLRTGRSSASHIAHASA